MLTEIAIASDYGERTHTPTVVDAVLPLPELMPREEPSPEDTKFRGGGVANLHGHTILWRATNRELTLELANLNGPETGAHVLSFVAPGPILSYCTTLSEGDEGHFVVDFLVKSGFLYTIHLPFSCFNSWNLPQTWRTVKCPFGVDCVTPLSLRSRGKLELVASLADGTVARLTRPNILAELEIHVLPDPTEPGFFGRVLGGSNKDEVPGIPGMSLRAAVDVCSFNDNIVCLSVNGKLRIWSTAKTTLVGQVTITDGLCTTPSNYLRVQGDRICVFSTTQFCVYNEKFELVDQYKVPESLHSWYMVDYLWTPNGIVAAFRAAQNSQIWCFEQDNTCYSVSVQKPSISRVPDAREMHRFIDNIFSVKYYSSMTLRKALAAFTNTTEADVANLTISAPPSSALSLRDAITDTVQKQALVEKTDYRLQWIRFDSLCQEFESQLNEALAVGVSSDGLFWSIRAAYYTLLCPISRVQHAISSDETASDDSDTTLQAINQLWNSVPPTSLLKFEDELRKGVLGCAAWGADLAITTISCLYESCILPHIDDRDVLPIRSFLTSVDNIDAEIKRILEACLIKDPAEDSENDTLTPLGCAALSTIALDHAENSLKFVSKVLFFTLFAFGEGRTKSHLQIYVASASHLRTSWSIVSLREPLESHSASFNAQTTALEISVSQLKLRVLDFSSLVARLWHKLDFTDVHNLPLIIKLIKERWSGPSLLNAVQYLLDDPESQFVKGLAKLSIREQQETGENIVRALAPQLSISAPNLGIGGFGRGIPNFFFGLTTLCGEIGISGVCLLNFMKLAVRYDSTSIDMCALYLELALDANNHVLAYEAICGLSSRGDPEIKQHLEKFLDAILSQRTMDYVCSELVFPGLVGLVPEILSERVSIGGLPTYKLLYTWYISRRNYLGAAKTVYNYIHGASKSETNPLDLYTITLNALKLVDKDARWFVTNKHVVTEADVEREYQNIYVKV